jgi:hypothetical protein
MEKEKEKKEFLSEFFQSSFRVPHSTLQLSDTGKKVDATKMTKTP